MRIPFAVQSYKGRSLPLSAQQLVNLYPEKSPIDAKAPVVLYGTPGLKSFASSVGDGPIRGAFDFNGVLCAVSGPDFFTVDSSGNATNRGTVGGTGRVPMDSNGAELAIVAGPGAGQTFIWNGTTLTAISDADFPGASDVTFMDGYLIFTKPNTDQFFLSALNDGTSYDALDIATAEGDPDDLVGCVNDHRELWLFGKKTTEVWYNSGNASFPFERIGGAYMERGCQSRSSIVKEDNSVFWLGEDGIVYRAAAYVPQRVSTHAVEFAIGSYTKAQRESATAFSYTMEGHKFYCLSFANATWVYDIASGMENPLWHNRTGYDATNNSFLPRWRADNGAVAYGKNLAGDYATGKIYELDMGTYQDDGSPVQRMAVSPPIHANGKRIFFNKMQIEIESGVGLTSGQGSDPQAMLEWSDDGGRTWSNEHWATMGKKGENNWRLIWRRLGWAYERCFRLTISDPVKVAIIAVDLETGTS